MARCVNVSLLSRGNVGMPPIALPTLETGMYLIGCTYNFCFPHHELSQTTHLGYAGTPAMAAGLTDHIWTVQEVFIYKIAPAPWVEPRRSRKKAGVDPARPKRPRGRPRKLA